MKKTILILLMLCLLPLGISQPLRNGFPPSELPLPAIQKIQLTLEHLQPNLRKNPEASQELAQAVYSESQKYGIDWKLLASILNQESSLRLDPQGCKMNKKACTGDYGVGQVRKRIWDRVEDMHFDGDRLLSEYSYAVAASAQVLNYYRERFQRKEMNWYTRYHSGTPERRDIYLRNLNRSFERINSYLEIVELKPLSTSLVQTR